MAAAAAASSTSSPSSSTPFPQQPPALPRLLLYDTLLLSLLPFALFASPPPPLPLLLPPHRCFPWLLHCGVQRWRRGRRRAERKSEGCRTSGVCFCGGEGSRGVGCIGSQVQAYPLGGAGDVGDSPTGRDFIIRIVVLHDGLKRQQRPVPNGSPLPSGGFV